MAKFSPSDAAFSGFALVKERPGAVAAWAVALLVFSAAIWALMIGLGLPTAIQTIWPQGPNTHDPAVARKAIQTLLPIQGGLLLLELVFYPILISAILRTFLDSRRRPFGGLRLGADELRMLWMIIRMCFVFWVIELISIVAAVVVGVLIVILLTAAHSPAILASLAHTLVLLLVFGWLFYVMVRFSLAIVVTAAEKRRGLRRSWLLTKGHFWSLFGAYILTFFIVMACEAVIMAVMLGIVGMGLIFTHVGLLDAFKALLNPGSNPTIAALFLVGNVALVWLGAALFAVMFGPSVAAYRAFSASSKSDAV